MAGGLNLYGYANGDPVNFADPYGLTGVELAVLAAQNLPAIQAAAAAAVAKTTAAVAAAITTAKAVLPYAQAGALNTVAGTDLGASLGYPNQVGVNNGGNLQPRTANGRWASSASNPGFGAALAANDAVQITVGAAQGFASGYYGTPMPGASTAMQQKAQESGKIAGELWSAFKNWLDTSPED